jgi:hypothetical protein
MEPTTGTGSPGNAHCHRMSIARAPPKARKSSPAHRNCLAMTLWSVEKTCFRRKEVGSG